MSEVATKKSEVVAKRSEGWFVYVCKVTKLFSGVENYCELAGRGASFLRSICFKLIGYQWGRMWRKSFCLLVVGSIAPIASRVSIASIAS